MMQKSRLLRKDSNYAIINPVRAMEPLVGRIRRRVLLPALHVILAFSIGLAVPGCLKAPRDSTDKPRTNMHSEQQACDSCIMDAAMFGKTETVDSLLKNGTDVNARDNNGWTPLHHAACSVDSKTCALLIDRGAEIDAINSDGNTPLMLAVSNTEYYCNGNTVKLLLEKGADPNKYGNIRLLNLGWQTPLMTAAVTGNTEVAALLLKHGAEINAIESYGTTALMRAIIEGKAEVAAFLVRNRADVNAKHINGQTALMLAAREGQPGIVSLLLENGANPDAKDKAGKTALMHAMENGHSKTAAVLKAAASAKQPAGK